MRRSALYWFLVSVRDYVEFFTPFVCMALFAVVLILSISGFKRSWSKFLFPAILLFGGLGPPLGAVTLLVIGPHGPSSGESMPTLAAIPQAVFGIIFIVSGSYGLGLPAAVLADPIYGSMVGFCFGRTVERPLAAQS